MFWVVSSSFFMPADYYQFSKFYRFNLALIKAFFLVCLLVGVYHAFAVWLQMVVMKGAQSSPTFATP